MPGVVDRVAAAERAGMLADDPPVLADHDAVGIGMNLDGTPDGARCHRVFVVIEAHQAGLRHRRLHRVESVEPAGIRNESAFNQTAKVTQGERARFITMWAAGMQQLSVQFATGNWHARRDAFWIAERLGSEFLTPKKGVDYPRGSSGHPRRLCRTANTPEGLRRALPCIRAPRAAR
jgi:hypothetical protein